MRCLGIPRGDGCVTSIVTLQDIVLEIALGSQDSRHETPGNQILLLLFTNEEYPVLQIYNVFHRHIPEGFVSSLVISLAFSPINRRFIYKIKAGSSKALAKSIPHFLYGSYIKNSCRIKVNPNDSRKFFFKKRVKMSKALKA
ncbi:hypothetical protein CEXT_600741 [Caerostris extrusa]|uniref:Uncharacterized protein n=1 Tax=Caerostris extrusa TaxID=172846 RepID=A0AAV4RAP5_CAEEX|nr:hypothetical protein CEXT_600741 [Caerostris extrusa]